MFNKAFKSIIIGMSMVLVLSFAACGSKTNDGDTITENMEQGANDVKDGMEKAADHMMK